jgi:arylsulfatase A-like enzyme
MDIHTLTSAVDVMPTLLHLTGEPAASWAEGAILPPFAPTEADPARPVYALHAKRNDPDAALTVATAMLAVDRLKLTYYFGYEELGDGVERVELYDVRADPEELHNVYSEQDQASASMLAMLKATLKEVNQPYS